MFIIEEKLKIKSIESLFGICRLDKSSKFSQWAVYIDPLYSVTETADKMMDPHYQEVKKERIPDKKNKLIDSFLKWCHIFNIIQK